MLLEPVIWPTTEWLPVILWTKWLARRRLFLILHICFTVKQNSRKQLTPPFGGITSKKPVEPLATGRLSSPLAIAKPLSQQTAASAVNLQPSSQVHAWK
jgi:hypothetical protein